MIHRLPRSESIHPIESSEKTYNTQDQDQTHVQVAARSVIPTPPLANSGG